MTTTPATRKPRAKSAAKLVLVEGVGTTLEVSEPKAPKSSKKAPAKKVAAPVETPVVKHRDTTIKTWTLAATEVRAAVASIRERMGAEGKGFKVTIGTRSTPVYATTKAEALVIPESDDLVEHVSVEKGTSLPEVRGHGYVAHLYFGKSEELTIWTVWLSPAGPVLLTVDGKKVK